MAGEIDGPPSVGALSRLQTVQVSAHGCVVDEGANRMTGHGGEN